MFKSDFCVFIACSANGVPYDKNCCTSESPCGEGEGDCDSDSHCKDGLKCGKDNCPSGNFSAKADCCTPGIQSLNSNYKKLGNLLVKIKQDDIHIEIHIF